MASVGSPSTVKGSSTTPTGLVGSGERTIIWVDKDTGLKGCTVAARGLHIAWGHNPQKWRWECSPAAAGDQSMTFGEEVAVLLRTSWLQIGGRIKLSDLSPDTNYAAYAVLKFGDESYGFDHQPATLSVICKDEKYVTEREDYLLPSNLRPREGDDHSWMEVEVGWFFRSKTCGEGSLVEFKLEETKSGYWMGGIVLRGIEIRPKSDGEQPPPLPVPILINGGTMLFWVDRNSGKKCYVIAARKLAITWGGDERYWGWESSSDSRFGEVAVLRKVCWLDISGSIKLSDLSPDTTYAAYVVLKLRDGWSRSLNDYPTTFSVVIKDEQYTSERQGYLRPSCLKNRDGDDLWKEVQIGEFYRSNRSCGDELVEFKLEEIKSSSWKRGIVLCGIEIRPKSDGEPILPSVINGVLFWVDRNSGKKCYMIAARKLAITWGDDERYWGWESSTDSRFGEVAVLRNVCWLDIGGSIKLSDLSPDTTYAAYVVLKLRDGWSRSLNDYPTTFSVVIKDEQYTSERQSYLGPSCLKNRDGDDLWKEVKIGEFFRSNRSCGDGLVEFKLEEIKSSSWKSGIVLCGIEIRPKSDGEPIVPIIINGVLFWVDGKSGKKCYMIAARKLAITWGDDERYWGWESSSVSRFGEVAVLRKVCWLDISGSIKLSDLSPDTTYAAYVVLKLRDGWSRSLNDYPTTFSVVIKDEQYTSAQEGYLGPSCLKNREGDDFWKEVKIGEFFRSNRSCGDGLVEFKLEEIKSTYWKSGIVLCGIEIRPKEL